MKIFPDVKIVNRISELLQTPSDPLMSLSAPEIIRILRDKVNTLEQCLEGKTSSYEPTQPLETQLDECRDFGSQPLISDQPLLSKGLYYSFILFMMKPRVKHHSNGIGSFPNPTIRRRSGKRCSLSDPPSTAEYHMVEHSKLSFLHSIRENAHQFVPESITQR